MDGCCITHPIGKDDILYFSINLCLCYSERKDDRGEEGRKYGGRERKKMRQTFVSF